MALQELQRELDQELYDLQARNRRGLMETAGAGGDAVEALGRRMGDTLSQAGVYNASTTAGTLAQAERDRGGLLTELAARNYATERDLLHGNQRYLTGMKLGVASDDIGRTSSELDTTRGGLASFLGSLGQYNLARSGAPAGNSVIPPQNGARNSVLATPGEGMQAPVFNLGGSIGPLTSAKLRLRSPGGLTFKPVFQS
jgi:hypothetical protein